MGAPSKPASRPADRRLASEAPTAEQVTAEPLALPSGAAHVENGGQGNAYVGPPPQLPPGGVGSQPRGWQFWVPSTILGMLAVGGLAVGGYFVGEGSRPSDDQIASKVTAAVSHQRAVDATAKSQALTAQRAELRRLFVRRGKRLASRAYKKGYQKGNSAGYSAGQSAGYSSGQDAGYQSGSLDGQAQGYAEGQLDGFIQGFDTAAP